MSATKIRLLILNDSRSEAERLISMLHNAGRPVRAQHVENEEALAKLLDEQVWDLMIGLDRTTNLPPGTAIKQIRRLNKDVPVILLTDDEGSQPVVEGMKMGAADVIRLDEDQHLLFVIQREIDNREQRNLRRVAERRHKEIERRNQQLLDSSRDAITFVQDGMFLYVNDSFAELMGYADRDELECMPVIDLVAKADRDRVKAFLKEFTIKGSDVDTTDICFTALTAEGDEKDIKVDVRKASYEDELCIQFLIRASAVDSEELEAHLQQIRNQDLATGLYNKNYLLEKLEGTVDQAVNGKANSALFCIGIESFMETVQTKLSVSSSDIVLGTIASHARTLIGEKDTLCRFGEDAFMLLTPEANAGKALKKAEALGKALRDYIVDIDGSTLQFNYALGIAFINETTADSDTPVAQSMKALELVRRDMARGEHTVARIYEPESSQETDSAKNVTATVQNALDEGNFRLLFQPILSLRGADKEHYEVLLRMLDGSGNEVSPTEFLKSAAHINATTKIDRWVILESIKVLAEHRSKGHDTRLIINLSSETFCDTSLPSWLAVAFKAAKLPADSLVFQLSEMDVNDHLNLAKSFTGQVTEMGAACSISHFGCALNPFNALGHVNAQYIKVDGSFTQELQNSTGERTALKDLVTQLHQEEKIIIVPFVENASVLSKLWQTGVHYIQGYYLQGPSADMNYDFDMEG
jgi:diguanylate cyclase (GGDEF)-like protein/PAS domain S-box-containing protein